MAWAGLLSPVGCVIFLFVALSRGWLVSAREMDRHERIWDARLTEAHGRETLLWKIVETSGEATRDATDQLRLRQMVDEVVVQAVAALPKPDERAG